MLVRHDLVISPFDTTAPAMVELARCAEESGFDGVWTYDHITGTMIDRGSSQDPFAVLGAIATATERVRVGPLVANMVNRHPAQLALAMATLQSLSDGRAVLGLGSGASPGSRWAQEHETLGTRLLDGASRRRCLAETIAVVRALWAGRTDFDGEFFSLSGADLGLNGEIAAPPIIVGATGRRTAEVALEVADGLNLTDSANVEELLALAAERRSDASFETSLHLQIDLGHPTGGPLPSAQLQSALDRRVLAIRAPFDLRTVRRIGDRIATGSSD